MTIGLALAFMPLIASAQYKDLDTAMSNLSRGFSSGDTQAIVAGMSNDDKVQLQFPDLIEQNGFYGRDQVTYILEGLFAKAKPTGFEQQSARKVSAEGVYHITASWNIQNAGKPETRELYITLRNKGDRWSIVSVRSAGK
jgi:hypothetical protein